MKNTKIFHEHLNRKSVVPKLLKQISFFAILLTLFNCSVSPKPIVYGEDGCYYCRMTIVDKGHAAEIVTKKGKAFKFDATECMVNYIKTIDQSTIKYFLSNNFIEPGTLIDATQAHFLISENIPSPMGAFLSAFKTEIAAKSLQKEKQGTIYTWNELFNQIN